MLKFSAYILHVNYVVFFIKPCRFVLSIYLQMVGSISPVTQSLFTSLCPCWFSCQSKASTSPPSDRLGGTGWIHFYSQKNKLASFHLDIKATNDGPHGLLNSLSVIVSYFWRYVTTTDAGIKRQVVGSGDGWLYQHNQRNVWNAAGH